MTTVTVSSHWVRGAWTLPEATLRLRLFCFAHSGGGASLYRDWAKAFSEVGIEVCPVQLPGREERLREAPFDRLGTLVPELAANLRPFLDQPFAFFGHSLGALVAFELATHLELGGWPGPVALFVSGCRAPRLNFNESPIHHLPQTGFINQVGRRYGGLPGGILAYPELLNIFIPALRADFTLLETYDYRRDHPANHPVSCPVRALGGLDDPAIAEAELDLWRSHTTASFGMRLFEGDHFFIKSSFAGVRRFVLESLETVKVAGSD
jgi:medium-chain acyl-[acyl-carrier-protein] hydrolase